MRVAWVKGLNRLYFLYEAYDDYWDFTLPGLHNDIFEIVVDGDMSGGPLIDEQHPYPALPWEQRYFEYHQRSKTLCISIRSLANILWFWKLKAPKENPEWPGSGMWP